MGIILYIEYCLLNDYNYIIKDVIYILDKYLYFAIFTPCEEGGYTITFNDLKGCITECDDIDEGIINAQEVLELHLFGMEEDNDIIPNPSKPEDIDLNKGPAASTPVQSG
jgi:predicted RNase H-like HicB family nuclease